MADQRTYKMLLGDIEAGGSGGLPDYSEANDGDVLEIENGEPAWAAPGWILICTETNGALDKTWQEIYDAMNSSVLCVSVKRELDDGDELAAITFNIIQDVFFQEGSYHLHLSDGTPFIASTANDYPVIGD